MSDYFSPGGLNTYLASMKRLLVCADSSTSVHLFFSKTRIFARIASKAVSGYSIIDCIPKSRKRLYGAENGLKIDFALFEISSCHNILACAIMYSSGTHKATHDMEVY